MNANELADALDDVVANYIQMIADVDFSDVATMLRQQQAELDRAVELYTDKAIENEALKQIIDANNLNQNIGQFVKPINEPVAWAVWEGRPHDLFFTKEDADELCRLKGGDAKTVPLYTHPVKELTDKEILGVWKENSSSGELYYDLLEFARAILRKAQEK